MRGMAMKKSNNWPVIKINGFSLTEIVIVIGVSAIVLGGAMTTLNLVSHGNAQQELLHSRDEIINKIRTQSTNPDNLTKSAEFTSSLGTTGISPDYGPPSIINYPNLLKFCLPNISNTPSAGCDKATIEEPGKGFLFYLTENAIIDPQKVVAGEDIYYRKTGMRCTTTEAGDTTLCPLSARVWFEPICLNFTINCNKASSLIIRYLVGLRTDYTGDNVIPSISSEFYVPLQKGVQIRNLLSDNDTPIYPNSKGIYAIPKYYGSSGQFIKGLRFEVTISNPEGLTSMRIQGRSLTGTDSKLYDETKIPDELIKKTWEDIPTPEATSLGAWSIDLSGAGPNQTFNFGTQLNVGANSRPPTSFAIGKSKSGSLDPTFHWTLNSDSTDYIPPLFKSGFYQFRVLTNDFMGGEIESSNYVTVRLISIPEFQYINGDFSLTRDCVNSTNSYSVFIADDEVLTFNQVKINGSIVSTAPVIGNKGLLNFNFSSNQVSGTYPVLLTLKNRFSDVSMETNLIPKVEDLKTIVLSDASVGANIDNDPEKVRYLGIGDVTLNYTSGNCCNSTPKATWSFLSSPYFGGTPLIAENSTGSTADYSLNMNCTVTGSARTCNTTIKIKGLKESPNIASPPDDISAALDLGAESSNPACQFSSAKPSGDPVGKYIPVINLPTIRFYITESLWIHNIPAGPATPSLSPTSIKPIVPRVYVRMDFAPANDVEVYIIDPLNPTVSVCDPIKFLADGNPNPIDKFCDIKILNFSGTLELRRKDDNPLTPFNKIAYESESTCIFSPAFPCDAQIAGATQHTICQKNFTSPTETSINNVPMPSQIVIPLDRDMLNSPYGVNADNSQKANNDYWVWKKGRVKQLRCYDNWAGNNTTTAQFNSPNNKQDYYDVFKYNAETRFSLSSVPSPIQYKLETPGAPYPNTIIFSNFNFPINKGALDYNSDNIPFLYLVSQSGFPENVVWTSPSNATSAYVTSGQQPWEPINGFSCTGPTVSGKAKTLQLYRVRPNINWNTATTSIITLQNIRTVFDDLNDRYSYIFMCDYGRWHPTSSALNSWTD